MKVLIVDDNSGIRRVVKRTVEEAGYEAILAADGYEALSAAIKEKPSVAFVDIQMPNIDGLTFTNLVSSSPLVNFPIVLLTSMSTIFDTQLGLLSGATDYITKPFDPAIIINQLKELNLENE